MWLGFTTDWYPKLFANQRPARRAVGITLQVARHRGHRRDDPGLAARASGWPGCGSAGSGATETLLLLPMVTPEIIMGISLLIFFSQLFGQNGSLGQIAIAHVTFCISYVAVTVRARAVEPRPAARGGGPRPRAPRRAARSGT